MKPFNSFALVLLAMPPVVSHGAATLTITSPNDLSNVHVGQTITFNVVAAGLDSAGQSLDTLAATVRTGSDLFSDPVTPITGSLLPDVLGFLGSAATVDGGAAIEFTGDYFGPEAPITGAGGIFFTFSLTAAAPGVASLSFVEDSVAAFPVGGANRSRSTPTGC